MTQEQLKRQAIFRIVMFFGIMITIGIYVSSVQVGTY